MPEFDFTTLFFAVVAVVVAVRLYMTLGTHARTDLEEGGKVVNLRRAPGSPAPEAGTTPTGPPERAAAARWQGVAKSGSAAEAGLAAIGAADPQFDARAFLEGARSAYAMIVKAFAAGDVATLRPLLAPDVLRLFSDQIAARRAAQRTTSLALIGSPAAEVESATLEAGHAHIVVRFAAKLLTSTRDPSGTIVEGSADVPEDHRDLWTFARDPKSADPNWTLLATEAVDAA